MAEGWTDSILCRYYINGACREGARCTFSHDRENARPTNICRYYQRGSCSYGDRCRYDHIKLDRQPPQQRLNSKLIPSMSQNHVGSTSSFKSSSLSGGHNGSGIGSNLPMMKYSAGTSSATGCLLPTKPIPKPNLMTSPRNYSPDSPGKMTVLRKHGQSEDSGIGDDNSGLILPKTSSTSSPAMAEWVNAPEFVPGGVPKSYAEAVDPTPPQIAGDCIPIPLITSDALCPYAEMQDCPYGGECGYVHGKLCDLCGLMCLHPTDEDQRKKHVQECVKEHERNMEHSFAIARSKDKTCGICMDVIMEKSPPSERRFGVLPNCGHVFCLACIRKWRNARQFENKLIRACPECRVASDFVTPSKYWVDTKEDKDKLIEDYRKALSLKHCKYFKQGRGECPFAGNCFYLHAYPDGRKAELPPPRPRRRQNADCELTLMDRYFLWDFLEERDTRWLVHLDLQDVLEDIIFSDDDDNDSDYSEAYEYLME